MSETNQKKSESAKVTHRTIISVIILMYSFVRTASSEPITTEDRTGCRTGGQNRDIGLNRWTVGAASKQKLGREVQKICRLEPKIFNTRPNFEKNKSTVWTKSKESVKLLKN